MCDISHYTTSVYAVKYLGREILDYNALIRDREAPCAILKRIHKTQIAMNIRLPLSFRAQL